MKKIFLILLFIIVGFTAKSQEHYIGVRGGITGGNIIMLPYYPTQTSWGGKEFGLAYTLIAGEQWVGGFQTEISYSENSYAILERVESDSMYVRNIRSIELPFFWHPYYNFGKKNNVRAFMNIGAYISYSLSSDYEYIDKFDLTSDYNVPLTEYQFNQYYDVRLGYGAVGGVGFEVMATPRIQLSAEFRYKFAFSDTWRYKSRINENVSSPTEQEYEQMYNITSFSQAQTTQMGVTFGVSYRFGMKKKEDKKGEDKFVEPNREIKVDMKEKRRDKNIKTKQE